MNVLGVIKIAAVVGLSALKVVSAVVKINEMKKQGMITPVYPSTNNSTPYQQPVYQQPANNMNSTYNVVQSQPVWTESRRFANPTTYPTTSFPAVYPTVYPTPQPQLNTVVPMMAQPQVSTWTNNNNVVVPNSIPYDPSSRRNTPMVQPVCQNPTWNNYNYSNNSWQSMKKLEPNWVSYPSTSNNMTCMSNTQTYLSNTMNNGTSYGYPYPYGSSKPYDTLDGWIGTHTPIQQNQSCSAPDPTMLNHCSGSRRQQTSLFNWQSPHLKWTPPWQNSDGVVAMFGAPDGTPLYGNPLAV